MDTLEQSVWNEQSVMELLGVTRQQMDGLRNRKGFPFVRLGQRIRVYLSEDILQWIKERRQLQL